MRALWLLALVLGAPLAAGAAFVVLAPPGVEEARTCGSAEAPRGADEAAGSSSAACFPLAPGESSVRIQGGQSYAFVGADGATLDAGTLCGARMLDVPAGAVLLRIDLAPCEP